jgi:tetratricopeptide (TPR) repeat protein
LEWAPFVDPRSGPIQPSDQGDLGKQSAGLLLERALKEDPGPASEHAFGLFNLATKKLNDAVRHLGSAAKGDPDNVAYHSDLGAALLEKGEVERVNGDESEASKDFIKGLEELDLALSINPDFRPALFNRALCLEGMQRWREAEDAWQTYLGKDSISEWATEARRRLDSVRQRK